MCLCCTSFRNAFCRDPIRSHDRCLPNCGFGKSPRAKALSPRGLMHNLSHAHRCFPPIVRQPNFVLATVQDAHLNASGYSITASDLLVATAKGSDPAPTVTVGGVELRPFQFKSPETTGTPVASTQLKASIRCATVPNNGCTGPSKPGTNGNSTCLACAGTVSHTVSGGGAYLQAGLPIVQVGGPRFDPHVAARRMGLSPPRPRSGTRPPLPLPSSLTP